MCHSRFGYRWNQLYSLESITITIKITDPLTKPLQSTHLLHFYHEPLWTLLFFFMILHPHSQSFLCLFSCVDFIISLQKHWYYCKLFILSYNRTITSIFKFQTFFYDLHLYVYTFQSFVLSPVFAWSKSMFYIFFSNINNNNENEPWNLHG